MLDYSSRRPSSLPLSLQEQAKSVFSLPSNELSDGSRNRTRTNRRELRESSLSIESKSKPICFVRRNSEASSSSLQQRAGAGVSLRMQRKGSLSDASGSGQCRLSERSHAVQVPGQFSYPSPALFEGGSISTPWQRRMMDLQSLQNESIKWETSHDSNRGSSNTASLLSGLQGLVPVASAGNGQGDRSLPLWR